jgi:hypothetical protein
MTKYAKLYNFLFMGAWMGQILMTFRPFEGYGMFQDNGFAAELSKFVLWY